MDFINLSFRMGCDFFERDGMQESFPITAFNEGSKGYARAPCADRPDCKAVRHLAQRACGMTSCDAPFCGPPRGFGATTNGAFSGSAMRYLLHTYPLPDRRMSIYQRLKGVSADNLHDFARRPTASREPAPEPEIEWRVRRKAKPCEEMLPATATWYAGLPLTVQPKALRERFPRIANGLAAAWRDRATTLDYFDDLLSDRRGGRKGFPEDALEELQNLKTFYEELNPAPGDVWRRAGTK
jgi:hypothetical protein